MAMDTTGAPRDTAIRYISMLSHIPVEPAYITAAELRRRLDQEDFVVDTRTIQRDLERLSFKFPLDNAPGHGRELRWFFRKGTASQWPAMSTDTALTLLLAEQNLKPLIPRQAMSSIESLVNQARETLKVQDKSGSRRTWAESVRVVPRGFTLQTPDIARDVMTAVFEAMGKHRQLKITTKSGKESVVNPLGLVMRGTTLYLICTYYTYTDIRMTVLHRIQSASVELTDLITPDGFDLDETLKTGFMGWRLDPGQIKSFELEVNEEIANYLDENRLSETQSRKALSSGNVLICFKAEDTRELRQWLLGFGPDILVRKPVAVKKWLIETAESLAARYKETTP